MAKMSLREMKASQSASMCLPTRHRALAIGTGRRETTSLTHFTTFCFSTTSLALTSVSALHAALSVKSPTVALTLANEAAESRLLPAMTEPKTDYPMEARVKETMPNNSTSGH